MQEARRRKKEADKIMVCGSSSDMIMLKVLL
jgi:hypothetical protein